MGAALVWALSSAVSIGFAVVFFLAINTLLNGVGTFVSTLLIGDVFEILSCCLPFSLVQLLGGMAIISSAVITFLTARKIFTILMQVLSGTTA